MISIKEELEEAAFQKGYDQGWADLKDQICEAQRIFAKMVTIPDYVNLRLDCILNGLSWKEMNEKGRKNKR